MMIWYDDDDDDDDNNNNNNCKYDYINVSDGDADNDGDDDDNDDDDVFLLGTNNIMMIYDKKCFNPVFIIMGCRMDE